MRKLIMLLAAGVAFGALAETATVGGYTWTIEGTARGLCIDAEVVDEAGNARPMVLWLSLDDDGHAVIESDGGSIRVLN